MKHQREVKWTTEYINWEFTGEDCTRELNLKVIRISVLLTDMGNNEVT